MRSLWMLVDCEPGYETFEVGETVTPTLYWIGPDYVAGGIPPELVAYDVPAHAETGLGDSYRSQARIRLSDTVSALAETWLGPPGNVPVSGLLFYDRYQWTQDRPVESTVTVLERGALVRARELLPTRHTGWFTPNYYGPNRFWTGDRTPEGHDFTWRCVRIGYQSTPQG